MDKSREREIKEAVKTYYAERARAVASCCGPAEQTCEVGATDSAEACCAPQDTELCSLGCGNPLAFCEIQEGEVVLDVGSGTGMDVLLAAERVGGKGKVIGLDMTPEMVETANRNAKRAGLADLVEFRLGEMEHMPVDDESVDWIISNCVVNLSPDKAKVFREAYRVLKPGGKMLVSDLVSSNLPEQIRDDLSAWAGCVAGTVAESECVDLIQAAGFKGVAVVGKADVTAALFGGACCGSPADSSGDAKIHSVMVRGVKPGG